MYTGRYYSLRDVAAWTRRETGVFVIISGGLTALHALAGWTWLIVPNAPNVGACEGTLSQMARSRSMLCW